ncbi:hypothetical protein GS597_15810 [Synechococcales cyanobacterium C]|uniref:Uncharacterized protein n=1 Tax=Petrachloros mirabilis ULC683 TaxID=2781853 RepID=A0A8K2A1I2_9CYAN|nr:hypothetical protein [Petrachloros mirabilis]NCJ07946.1 hypothetical protein [Petrachloros mirabilis ULC683]
MTDSNGTNATWAGNLNILTEQIGRLTEVVTVGFGELKDGMSELKELVREQSEISKRQEQHISRLVDTVGRQADTVARQAELVDALIRDRQHNPGRIDH